MSMSNLPRAKRTYKKPKVDCQSAKDGRTKQSFKDECNINSIIAKYQRTGMMDHVRDNPGVYADVAEIGDYHEMTRKIRKAQESFDSLTPELRSRFNNDPGKLIAFMSDPKNVDEAITLGLVNKPKTPTPPASKDPVTEPKVDTPPKDPVT